MESLEKQLQRATKLADETGGGILVITEGVFGMSGNPRQSERYCRAEEKYKFRLFVDDAHGFGTMGKTVQVQARNRAFKTRLICTSQPSQNRWPASVHL